MYTNNNSVTYIDSFGLEHIPKEIKAFILTIKTLKQIPEYDSVMCEYFCIGFIDLLIYLLIYLFVLSFKHNLKEQP